MTRRSSGKNAALVGAGILSSRLIGIVRESIFAHYFGNTAAADAFKAALKIPNFLQNLFGEGALSSSFIPVYAGLLASGEKDEANKVARVIGSILALAMSVLVLAGVLATPFLIDLVAPGFEGLRRESTIRMVRILFPGIGLLVFSAWCLGILNSHRKFFLPYAAPILWSLAMIVAMLGFSKRTDLFRLAEIVAWGSVVGSALQFGVQLPSAMRLIGRFRFELDLASANIRIVLRNFVPGVLGRGVNQLSSYIDSYFASYLLTGAVAALAYAQALYLLPVSLFGSSISNAELPEMVSHIGTTKTISESLCKRLNEAMRRVAFFIIPSITAFLALGDSIIAPLFQRGEFTHNDTSYVWIVLAGSTLGLLASTLGRLYTSTYWALRDTRTPFYFAALRVALTTALGWFLAFPVPRWLGLPPRMGLVGLTASAGMAGWVEFTLLRIFMNRRIGKTGLRPAFMIKLWSIAIAAAAVAFALKYLMHRFHPLISGPLVLMTFGAVYFAGALALKVSEATQLFRSITARFSAKS
jgi:putative peptidoglycan lipid II flippase